jgi:hypothetical protein
MREIEERLRGAGGGGNGGLAPGSGERRRYEFERETELPDTPGWMPKLTPTRKGDELFLSVQ